MCPNHFTPHQFVVVSGGCRRKIYDILKEQLGIAADYTGFSRIDCQMVRQLLERKGFGILNQSRSPNITHRHGLNYRSVEI
jgi:hypothetical protein